ncbi:4'-phosphopantetheinyl transferase family protein [Streptomyces sp. SPB074]|uniref:4'-phosphopantetheinyl transferase family protein n=1 Tax=Streptomyces sp. (strain SPB074) TaxID=465543 RepID=UPI0001D1E2AE|nr:4'-phosphopantetheinyl transferase superfamily protein [Streptomyces sp. SPB074]EFG64478.1 4'-phosphopantetheinyl transferase [Streptomyces sp. SPB074]
MPLSPPAALLPPDAGSRSAPVVHRLAPGPATLHLLPEAAVDAFAARAGGAGVLSAAERERWARLRGEAARRRHLGARLLVRHALSAHDGRPPHRWHFTAGPWGRPELPPPDQGLRFNLSHTDGLLACVVTPAGGCGVDVEGVPARPDALTHLPPHLAPAERAALDALDGPARAVRLAELWVLKEAYLKALGTGLTRPLSTFTFRDRGAPGPGAAPLAVDDPLLPAAEAARWRLRLLRPGPRHVLGLALQEPVTGEPAAAPPPGPSRT